MKKRRKAARTFFRMRSLREDDILPYGTDAEIGENAGKRGVEDVAPYR